MRRAELFDRSLESGADDLAAQLRFAALFLVDSVEHGARVQPYVEAMAVFLSESYAVVTPVEELA